MVVYLRWLVDSSPTHGRHTHAPYNAHSGLETLRDVNLHTNSDAISTPPLHNATDLIEAWV